MALLQTNKPTRFGKTIMIAGMSFCFNNQGQAEINDEDFAKLKSDLSKHSIFVIEAQNAVKNTSLEVDDDDDSEDNSTKVAKSTEEEDPKQKNPVVVTQTPAKKNEDAEIAELKLTLSNMTLKAMKKYATELGYQEEEFGDIKKKDDMVDYLILKVESEA